MITSKDRARLRSIASTENAVYQIGKDGLTPDSIKGIEQALTARELIKINVLQNCDENPKELANELARIFSCEVIGVIGKKILLYKLNPNNKKHVLSIQK